MIAKYLDEAVLLQKGNTNTLVSVMRNLHGSVIPGIISKEKDIRYWFWKEFCDRFYISEIYGSIICISYINLLGDGRAVWKIYLFGKYTDGDIRNVERNIGKPFPVDDKAAMKVSELYMRKFMLAIMKQPNREKTHDAIVSLYSDMLNHDWSGGNKP